MSNFGQGHNFGANHASVINGGSRGRVAWVDSATANVVEYGNPHSLMGQGDITVTPMNAAQFLVEGKAVFDWVSDTLAKP